MSDLTLYGIVEEMSALEEILEQEQGEFSDELEELTNQVQLYLENKVDGCVGFIQKQKDIIKLARDRKKALDELIKSKEKQIENFSKYVSLCMEKTGKKQFEGSMHTIKLRKPSKAVEIFDENAIPPEFLTVIPATTKIKKADIKKALKNGQDVSGAKLVDGALSLQIGATK